MNNKILRFAPKLVPHILEKNKHKTYRLKATTEEYIVGEEVDIQNSETKKIFGKAIIMDIFETTFKNLPLKGKGQARVDYFESLRTAMNGYYEKKLGRKIEDEDKFVILSFKLL